MFLNVFNHLLILTVFTRKRRGCLFSPTSVNSTFCQKFWLSTGRRIFLQTVWSGPNSASTEVLWDTWTTSKSFWEQNNLGQYVHYCLVLLTLVLLNKLSCHAYFQFSANQITWSGLLLYTYFMAISANPDQLASSEANGSGSILFAKAGYIRVQQDKG